MSKLHCFMKDCLNNCSVKRPDLLHRRGPGSHLVMVNSLNICPSKVTNEWSG